jgi:hypothetical protein
LSQQSALHSCGRTRCGVACLASLEAKLASMPRITQAHAASLPALFFRIDGGGSKLSALQVLLHARDAIASADAAASHCSAAHDCSDALADAEVLLSHAIGTPRHTLRLNLPKICMRRCHAALFSRSVNLRCSGIPVPYITRSRHFFEHEFFVTSDVLIPRPETELVITEALRVAPLLPPSTHEAGALFTLVDLGCGSGV